MVEGAEDTGNRSRGSAGVRVCDHAPVDLADAGALRFACSNVCAGAGAAVAGQDSLWRIPPAWRRLRAARLEAAYGGALGADAGRSRRSSRARNRLQCRSCYMARCLTEERAIG